MVLGSNVHASMEPLSGSIKLVSGEFDPYCGVELPKQGVSTQVVTAVFASLGKKVEIEFVPWGRALGMLHSLESAGSYPWAKNKEREKDLLYSNPLHTDSVRLFGKQDIAENKTESWHGKKVCIPASWEALAVEPFIRKHQLRLERPLGIENCFKMLEYGRVDLVFVNELVGYRVLKKLYDGKTNIGPVGHYHRSGHSYFIVPKNYPGAERMIKDFNSGLLKISKNGVYKSIMDQTLE